MKILNTMTGKKEEFVPIKEGKISMYVCGPTVYNFFHIGNARPFVIFDTMRRYLKYLGYEVTYVQNFTDVDDKIIAKANEEGVEAGQISEKYIREYFKDAKALNIMPADIHPRVSENMPEIISFIDSLIKQGHAYESDGDVYFDVSSFKDYGKLSKQSKEELISGARVKVNEEKRNPLDFALWKKMKPGEPYWDSPWGGGRPGWHIECSAMSRKYLGETIDIHGGGQDLIFPHHENEIAQSESLSKKPFVHYWMHNGYINVDNVKMSKSLGNFFTVRDISEKFDLEAVRLFIVSAHYKSPINFSEDSIKQAANALERLYNVKNNLKYAADNSSAEPSDKEEDFIKGMDKFKNEFEEAMNDDLNTANALSALFELARYINIYLSGNAISAHCAKTSYDRYMMLADILGLLYKDEETSLDDKINEMIEKRQKARREKDFRLADEIRDELREMGIELKDTREGVKWRKL